MPCSNVSMKRASSAQHQARQLTTKVPWEPILVSEKGRLIFFLRFARTHRHYAPLCSTFASMQFLCPGNFSILATPPHPLTILVTITSYSSTRAVWSCASNSPGLLLSLGPFGLIRTTMNSGTNSWQWLLLADSVTQKFVVSYCMIPYKFKGCWCANIWPTYGTAVTSEQCQYLHLAQLWHQNSNDNFKTF